MAIIDTTGWTRLIRNATVATCTDGRPYGLIPNGAIALAGKRIAWVGARKELPAELPKNAFDAPVVLATPAPPPANKLLSPGLLKTWLPLMLYCVTELTALPDNVPPAVPFPLMLKLLVPC